MSIAAKVDGIGKPAWIVLTVLGFMAWWPLGLATLAFIIWSGRMGDRVRSRFGGWFRDADQAAARACSKFGKSSGRRGAPSGNHAFDEYRDQTVRRLEEEEREFRDFLDRLRLAKDKAEFDAFMNERRGSGGTYGSAVPT